MTQKVHRRAPPAGSAAREMRRATTPDRARPRTVDGSTSVSAAALQLYAKRYASLSAASQSAIAPTVTPTHEQPAAKQCARAAKEPSDMHALQLSAVLHDRFTVARRSTC